MLQDGVKASYDDSTTSARRNNHLQENLDRQAHALEVLEGELGALFSKIDPILTPIEPSPSADGTGEDRRNQSELANHIDAVTERLQVFIRRIARTAERIEL